MTKAFYIFFLLQCIAWQKTFPQDATINFHKLGIDNGLHDGTVRCIGQDKFGYMWIGTIGALNRFDGKAVKHFTNIPGDTSSVYSSQPRSILSDENGRLWIGFETGLVEFNFSNATFKRIPFFKDLFVGKIISCTGDLLYLTTNVGLLSYNINTNEVFNYSISKLPQHAALLNNAVGDIKFKHDSLFLATAKGVVLFSIKNNNSTLITLPVLDNIPLRRIDVDEQHNIWIGTYGEIKLVKLFADLKTTEVYDRFLSSSVKTQPLNVTGILCDNKNRIWVTTAIDGLLQYKKDNNSFIKYLHNNNLNSSPTGNNYRSIFQDKAGTIWLGCDANGANYFEPDKNHFTTIFPFPDRLDERGRAVGRALAEDKQGNIWMGNHDGITKYNPTTNTYASWRNEEGKAPVIYSNLVRTMLCDDDNNIWIGTGAGVNLFNSVTQKMEFINSKKLPLSFYNSITKDKSGNLWFCTYDTAVVYWYNTAKKEYHNISDHPQLKKFTKYRPASYVYEDSKSRLWISFNNNGLVMFDKKSSRVMEYTSDKTGGQKIIGNLIVDIKEDSKGIIWVSSFNGISGINVEQDSVSSFNNRNGLVGNSVSSLAVDSLNQLWIGVNGGLMMLDQSRKKFITFSLSDGLPSAGFPEHAGLQLHNGNIVFPTYNGFVKFNPVSFTEEPAKLQFYLSGYSIFNKEYPVVDQQEDALVLRLKANENFFTFNLTALNYLNPGKTWFAYKLDGFEKEWHFTQDAKAVYTNVPGGNYSFLYKAAVNNNKWNTVAAKKISVKLETIFYRSAWFALLIAALTTAILIWLYRYRLRQQRQMFQLKGKAQLLEKEKTMVMYESLKQQLNPHFLFNSLTSLSGLIETDQQMAGSFLEQMSGIYRYILKNGDKETVTIKDEIAFVNLYINLQQTRFKKGLQVNINIPEAYLDYKIAPVTLQNLIENAIKHNIIDAECPLIIDIYTEPDYLIVKNNLQKKTMVETSNKKGLMQFETLYKYLTEKPIIIEESNKIFVIKIPLI